MLKWHGGEVRQVYGLALIGFKVTKNWKKPDLNWLVVKLSLKVIVESTQM